MNTVVQVGLEMSRKELDNTIAMLAEAEAVTIMMILSQSFSGNVSVGNIYWHTLGRGERMSAFAVRGCCCCEQLVASGIRC